MKITILVFMVWAIIVTMTKAEVSVGPVVMGRQSVIGPSAGFPPPSFFLDVVLQSEAQKLFLATPGLTEDLQKRVLDTLSNAELAFNDCSSTATTMLPWVQIRCIALQLQKSKNELKTIEAEAKARSETGAGTGAAPSA